MAAGRHAQPRSSPSYTAPLAVAMGLGVAGSSALAPTAEAAPSVDWDKVAECESSGNWAANTGNGYFGGLQFLPSTWRAFGGTGMPHQASRAEQIRVAERTRAGQGIGAWPTCGPRGLGGSTTPTRTPRTSTSTTEPSPRPSTPSTRSPSPETPMQADPTHYRVRPGDTLSKIAQDHRTPGGYRAIAAANTDAITDVGMIYVGEVLTLPTSAPARRYDRPRAAPSSTTTTPRAATTPPVETSSRQHTARRPTTSTTTGRPTSHAVASSTSGIVAEARRWIGVRYLYGGNNRRGVDCSGLVQQVYRSNRQIILPRTTRQQMAAATRITRAEARPGDLVGNPSGTHIGIYIGGGQMIDAPSSGGFVGVHTLYRDMTRFGRVR